MASLWQKLRRKMSGTAPETKTQVVTSQPLEFKHYNPLHLRLNDGVKIKTIDLEDLDFKIQSIRETIRHQQGVDYPFVDYDLIAHADTAAIKYRLRLVPSDNKDSELSHDAILFKLVADFEGNDEYLASLAQGQVAEPVVDKSGKVVQDAQGRDVMDMFERVNKVKEPWLGVTNRIIPDTTRTAGVACQSNGALKYWDHWRDATDADGNEFVEFYNVEVEPDNGNYTSIWRGAKIDANRVSVP